MSTVNRKTNETDISLSVTRGTGVATVEASDVFLGHMVTTLARYSGFDISLRASGDLRHHLVEDVAISLGKAFAEEIGGGVARYGWAQVPMDEALVEAAIDVGGRPYFVGRVPSKLYTHFLHSLATNARATLHVRVLRGSDRHHVVEAAIKALGFALRQAAVEGDGVFSTKGAVDLSTGDDA